MRLPFSEPEDERQHLTPLIDVVFLLLIFFLVATRFDQEEREIDTVLPEVSEAHPLSMPPDEVIVNVTEEGEYRVVGKTYGETALAGLLHSRKIRNPHQRVLIRAHERVPWVFPARVMGICEYEDIEHACSVLEERLQPAAGI